MGTLSGLTKQSTIKEQANISISNNENIEHKEKRLTNLWQMTDAKVQQCQSTPVNP